MAFARYMAEPEYGTSFGLGSPTQQPKLEGHALVGSFQVGASRKFPENFADTMWQRSPVQQRHTPNTPTSLFHSPHQPVAAPGPYFSCDPIGVELYASEARLSPGFRYEDADPIMPDSVQMIQRKRRPRIRTVASPAKDTQQLPRCYAHGCNGREFSTMENFHRHQRERDTSNHVTCRWCGLIITRRSNMEKHVHKGTCEKTQWRRVEKEISAELEASMIMDQNRWMQEVQGDDAVAVDNSNAVRCTQWFAA